MADDAFDAMWRELEVDCKCDGFGGMQYERIRKMWLDMGEPLEIADLICYEANCMPDAPPWAPPASSEPDSDAD